MKDGSKVMKSISLNPEKLLGFRLAVVEAKANGIPATAAVFGLKQGEKAGLKFGMKDGSKVMKSVSLDPAKLLGFRLVMAEAKANGNSATTAVFGLKQGDKPSLKFGAKVGGKPVI